VNLEDAIVQLVRLGLRGDTTSVGHYAKRLLRDLAQQGASPKAREALAALVASAPTTVARFVEPLATDLDHHLVMVEPPGDVEAPVLDRGVAGQVDEVLQEHARAAELDRAGLHATRTMLFTGPPGVGKTLTARSMASRLGVPLFRIDLSALMSSFLGKSSQNLRAALAQARSVPSVMLLDEFDSIGKRRDDPSDVGELKRIVNVLLMELEAWPASGMLVAATNHPELLDRAVWRRFERVVEFDLPSSDARRELIQRNLAKHSRTATDRTLRDCVAGTVGASGSDLSTFVRSVVRKCVLSGTTDIDRALVEGLVERLAGRARTSADARRLFCELCSRDLSMTQREIAAHLGISHVAVGKLLRSARDAQTETRHITGKTTHA
jgi:Cdc6-like AAA superfamily ATPase